MEDLIEAFYESSYISFRDFWGGALAELYGILPTIMNELTFREIGGMYAMIEFTNNRREREREEQERQR